jgi:hypothetical protein
MIRQGMFVGVLVLLSFPAWGHKTHSTLAEMEWDSPRLEVSMQLHTADLNKALSASPSASSFEEAVESLVRKHVIVRDRKKSVVPITWVGVEEAAFGVWVYFEWKLEAPLSEYTLEHGLFLDVEPTTVHTVNVREGKAIKSLRFHSKYTRKKLDVFPDSKRNGRESIQPVVESKD